MEETLPRLASNSGSGPGSCGVPADALVAAAVAAVPLPAAAAFLAVREGSSCSGCIPEASPTLAIALYCLVQLCPWLSDLTVPGNHMAEPWAFSTSTTGLSIDTSTLCKLLGAVFVPASCVSMLRPWSPCSAGGHCAAACGAALAAVACDCDGGAGGQTCGGDRHCRRSLPGRAARGAHAACKAAPVRTGMRKESAYQG